MKTSNKLKEDEPVAWLSHEGIYEIDSRILETIGLDPLSLYTRAAIDKVTKEKDAEIERLLVKIRWLTDSQRIDKLKQIEKLATGPHLSLWHVEEALKKILDVVQK